MRVIEDVRRDVEELVCKALRDASVPAAVERIRRELALAIGDGRVELAPPFLLAVLRTRSKVQAAT